MKKELFFNLLTLGLALLFYSCERENNVFSKSNETISQKSGAAISQNSIAGRSSGSPFCSGPYDGMPLTLVRDMVANYKQNQLQAIKNCNGIKDARACWFDLERLKDYICRLETEVAQRGCINPENLGLRFYYGAHSKTQPLEGVPSSYKGLHTLIIIPTYANEAGNNVDFDPTKFDSETCKPVSLSKLKGTEKIKNVLTMDLLPGNIFAIDHGQLGPPDSLVMGF
jgi:hypothetical protein